MCWNFKSQTSLIKIGCSWQIDLKNNLTVCTNKITHRWKAMHINHYHPLWFLNNSHHLSLQLCTCIILWQKMLLLQIGFWKTCHREPFWDVFHWAGAFFHCGFQDWKLSSTFKITCTRNFFFSLSFSLSPSAYFIACRNPHLLPVPKIEISVSRARTSM